MFDVNSVEEMFSSIILEKDKVIWHKTEDVNILYKYIFKIYNNYFQR